MILLRALLYNLGFWLITLVIGVVALPALLLPRRYAVRVSEAWTRTSLAWLGASVGLHHELRGREHMIRAPAIYAFKHLSAWDTLYLNQLLRDPAVVLKRELLFLPLVGFYFMKTGMIPIDRKGGARALKAMIATAEQAVAQGRPIAIFPEGTRAPVGVRRPFHPGVGALYVRLGLPIVPVALNSGCFWGRRAFLKRPGRITVEVLPPIPPGLDRRKAIQLLEERINEATDRLVAEAAGSPARPHQDAEAGISGGGALR